MWLTLLAGAIGFGGMFAVYSYIAPTVTEVGGLPSRAVPVFLLAFGLGMVAGTWLAGAAGRLVDLAFAAGLLDRHRRGAARCSPCVAPYGWWAIVPVAFLITVIGSVLVVNLQLRLMDVAGDAQTLGAAMNHASLNIANALGAWLGGIVIAAGYGYRSTAVVGAAALGRRIPGRRGLGLGPRARAAEGRRRRRRVAVEPPPGAVRRTVP